MQPIGPMLAIALCIDLLQQSTHSVITTSGGVCRPFQQQILRLDRCRPVDRCGIKPKAPGLLQLALVNRIGIDQQGTGRVGMPDQATAAVQRCGFGGGPRVCEALDTPLARLVGRLFEYGDRALQRVVGVALTGAPVVPGTQQLPRLAQQHQAAAGVRTVAQKRRPGEAVDQGFASPCPGRLGTRGILTRIPLLLHKAAGAIHLATDTRLRFSLGVDAMIGQGADR